MQTHGALRRAGASASRSIFSGRRRVRGAVMARAERKIWVKGDPSSNTLGDCPFCHRALLTLELKVSFSDIVVRCEQCARALAVHADLYAGRRRDCVIDRFGCESQKGVVCARDHGRSSSPRCAYVPMLGGQQRFQCSHPVAAMLTGRLRRPACVALPALSGPRQRPVRDASAKRCAKTAGTESRGPRSRSRRAVCPPCTPF